MRLYIIHGWTYTVKSWERTIELLEQSGIHVTMLHVPGLTAPSDQVWTIEDYVKWADDNIPDGSIALGHSNGGRILLNLLSQNPKKLRHLILLNSAGIYEPSRKVHILRVLSKIFYILGKIKLLRRIIYKIIGAGDYNQAPPNMKKTLDNMLQSDRHLNISTISTPTTIIWGEADTTTPLRQGRKIHSLLPNSSLIVEKNWPHAPYIKYPESLAKTLTQAIKKVDQ